MSDGPGLPPKRGYSLGFCDPATLPEFEAVRAAIRRGSRRSRLRRLAIVCHNGDLLSEVFGPSGAEVLLVRDEAALLRDLPERVPFFSPDDPPLFDHGISVLCRCRNTSIVVRWIKDQLRLGNKRAVWRG
ncbi:MAG: hypothetical protein ACRDR6_13510 [Pseudonocardiaceae bacterium]